MQRPLLTALITTIALTAALSHAQVQAHTVEMAKNVVEAAGSWIDAARKLTDNLYATVLAKSGQVKVADLSSTERQMLTSLVNDQTTPDLLRTAAADMAAHHHQTQTFIDYDVLQAVNVRLQVLENLKAMLSEFVGKGSLDIKTIRAATGQDEALESLFWLWIAAYARDSGGTKFSGDLDAEF